MFGLLNPSFLQEMNQIADYENININFTSSQTLGQRITQEDRYLIINLYFGTLAVICDGHRSGITSESVILNIPTFINEEYKLVMRKIGTVSNITINIEKQILRNIFKKLHQLTSNDESGTTVSMLMIRPIARDENKQRRIRLAIATIGDSPLTVFDKKKYVHMPLHSAEYYLPDRHRIEKNKLGFIENGYLYSNKLHRRSGGIAMSRALGDAKFNSVLSRKPAIKCFDISTNAKIILCSDGVLNSSEPIKAKATMRHLIKKMCDGVTAQEMLSDLGKTHDNSTLICVSFREPNV